jgi:hypothetical protein
VDNGKKLNTEGTEVAHRGHGEEQVDNRDWQHGWVRGNGKAIAMVAWGHLLFALFGSDRTGRSARATGPRGAEVRGGANQASHTSSIRRRAAVPFGGPA